MDNSELNIILVIMVVLVGVLTVNVLTNILSSVKQLEKNEEPCRLHDWYDWVDEKGQNRGLICNRCKKVPQIESRDDYEND